MASLQHRGRVVASIAALLALVIAYLFWQWSGREQDDSRIIMLRSALRHLQIDGVAVAPDQLVPLPYHWDRHHAGQGGRARFTFTPDAGVAAGSRAWALYFARIGNRYQVRVNGSLIADAAVSPDANQDLAKMPRIVQLAPGVLRGNDLIEIDIWCDPLRRGGLSAIELGPASTLTSKHEAAYSWRAGGSLGMAAISAAMGGLGLLLWLGHRSALYLTYGLAEGIWAFRVSDILIVAPPLSWPLWGAVVELALASYVGLLTVVVLRVLQVQRRWLNPALLTYLGASLFVCLWSYHAGWRWLWSLWIGVMIGIAVACTVTVLRIAFKTRQSEQALLAVALVAATIAGAHDWLQGWLTQSGFGTASLTRYVTVLFGLSIAWIFARRYNRAVVELADSNAQLEQRIAARERELRAAFEAARQTEQTATALAERNRLMRDMHDGVGSLLSAALRSMDRRQADGSIARSLVSDALDELKMTVDSLQPNGDDLGTVLGSIRFRLQDRMRAAGVECGWNVPPLPPFQNLGPAAVRHVQHLILEAFGNAMAHGGATRIALSARACDETPAQVIIEIEDNGVGFDPTMPSRGQGLRIMRSRAADLGGELILTAAPGQGSRISIRLPVRLAA